MKYANKESLKEQAIKLYLNGKNYIEISQIIGCSRNYVSTLIRNDKRIIEYKNKKIVKLYKHSNDSRITIPISLEYWEKIGISKNPSIDENIEISVNEQDKEIVIKKHNI